MQKTDISKLQKNILSGLEFSSAESESAIILTKQYKLHSQDFYIHKHPLSPAATLYWTLFQFKAYKFLFPQSSESLHRFFAWSFVSTGTFVSILSLFHNTSGEILLIKGDIC
jgi:hypothetical protein